jgi:hypothetical protein
LLVICVIRAQTPDLLVRALTQGAGAWGPIQVPLDIDAEVDSVSPPEPEVFSDPRRPMLGRGPGLLIMASREVHRCLVNLRGRVH